MNLFTELKRRHVFRIGIAYLIVAWLITQVVVAVSPVFDLPTWFPRAVLILLAVGFPIALVVAWAFELTPEGIKRSSEADGTTMATPGISTGRKLDFVIIGALILALGYFVWDRYYGASDGTSAASAVPSIAVLPFKDFSPNQDQEYFADGITEELLNSLAQLKDLRVAGRTSSFYFKGKDEDLRTIGEKLGVENLLEGSVRKADDEVRITAQLVNARTGYHLWSDTYDRQLTDIFSVQADIAKSVAESLEIALGVGDLGHMQGMTGNVEAYDEYLAGHAAGGNVQGADLRRAISHYQKAIDIDPTFSLAWLGLFNAHFYGSVMITDRDPRISLQEAMKALNRAEALTPNAPAVLVALADQAMARADWSEASKHYDALRTQTRNASKGVNFGAEYGKFLLFVGRPSEALPYLEDAKIQDPLDAENAAHLSMAYEQTGSPAAAIAEQDRGIGLEGFQSILLGSALSTALGENDHALIAQRLRQLAEIPDREAGFDKMAQLLDDRPAARQELRQIYADPSRQSYLTRLVLARWAAYFDDPELALMALRSLPADDFSDAIAYTLWDKLMRDVRKLPGFKDLVRDMGLVDYWRETGKWSDFCHPISSSNGGNDDFECE